MDDIVERLQEHEYICCGGHDFALRCKSCVLHIEAADEIERLRAEIIAVRAERDSAQTQADHLAKRLVQEARRG